MLEIDSTLVEAASTTTEFHIFREERRLTSAGSLVAHLRSDLLSSAKAGADRAIRLLLRAGELECALSDAGASLTESTHPAELTDRLAAYAVRCHANESSGEAARLVTPASETLDNINPARPLSVTTPEGFAHYALHPLDYADLVCRLKLESRRAFIIGIRSIGTTLSAVVTAQLKQLGISAERTTVRPNGHPYGRSCEFLANQRPGISLALAKGAQFLVCDEGPGRSGSSLLSVAEALEREDVPPHRITLLCSHHPDAASLCAPDAARRWSRYLCAATGKTRRLPAEAGEFLGGGAWRQKFIGTGAAWPAVWPQMERLKYLSTDEREMLTFDGYGHYGARVGARHQLLSDAGFTLRYLGHAQGFGRHGVTPGRLSKRSDLTPARMRHMADYCAWRTQHFSGQDVAVGGLLEMFRVNFEREFGGRCNEIVLPLERPTICDARMAPHEWLLAEDGRFLKLNAAIHGDDHFFPGPCDIAWDLAGVIVEWELSADAREFFLAAYLQASGDDARLRIRNYELAYATFRLAWSKMAAASVDDPAEERRLLLDYGRYRHWVEALVDRSDLRRSA